MAHFAKLGAGNIVKTVVVVHNNIATTEQAGVDFLNNLYKTNDVWKQTSYNTRGGVHQLGGTPFRKNYAGKGSTYDEASKKLGCSINEFMKERIKLLRKQVTTYFKLSAS